MKDFLSTLNARTVSVVCISALTLSLGACSSITRMSDIPEYLDSEFDAAPPKEFITMSQLNQIRLGMSPLAVQNAVGKPMVVDNENKTDDWDYIVRSGSGESEEYKAYRVYFKQDQVVRVAPLSPPPESIVGKEQAVQEVAPVAETDLGTLEAVDAPAASIDVPVVAEDAAVITDLLNNWAAAWSSQDVDAYMAFYADTFEHGKGSRSKWEASRSNLIKNKSFINVSLTDIQIDMQSDVLAVAKFTQDYQSDKFNQSGPKQLVMSKASGEWKIQKETFMK